MKRALGFGALWLGFSVYAFGFAPPDRPDTFELIVRMATGDWAGINPAVLALFNLMGIWPLIYAYVLLADGRGQRLWAWPFVTASFGVGAFALLPYLALRRPNPSLAGTRDWLLKFCDRRLLALPLLLATIALLVWGIGWGDWADFGQQWRSDRFIHVMSLDFCLLTLLFPTILGDDLARRGLQQPGIFWAIALVPLLGPAAYLCWRPPLQEATVPVGPPSASLPKVPN